MTAPSSLPERIAQRARLLERLSARLSVATEDKIRKWYAHLLPLTELRVPLTLLRGTTRVGDRPATMLVAGDDATIDYLRSGFFATAPLGEIVGHATAWSLPRLLRRLRAMADLTVARVDRLSARAFFADDYFAVPDWVGSELPVPADLAGLFRRNASVADDVRKTRKRGMTAEITHSAADFDAFYRSMYVPYLRNRHGRQAYVQSARSLRRALPGGGILWVRQGGQRIAGTLFARDGAALRMVAIGVANGEQSWLRRGALSAIYVHVLEHARSIGCSTIDVGGSRPSLYDGLLRYKRKWGATLCDKHNDFHSTLVYWNRLDDKVAGFLSRTPLIFRDGDDLCGLAVVNRRTSSRDDDLLRTRNHAWVPGLRHLYILADSESTSAGLPPSTSVLDLAAVASQSSRALRVLMEGERASRRTT